MPTFREIKGNDAAPASEQSENKQDLDSGTPSASAEGIQACGGETEKWAKVIKFANTKPECRYPYACEERKNMADFYRGFEDVDHSADDRSFFQFLDLAGQLPSIAEYRERMLDLCL